MNSYKACKYILKIPFVLVTIIFIGIAGTGAMAQQAADEEVLRAIEVEPPEESARRVETRSDRGPEGFGYNQPIPSGMPFSDYSLTPSEVVSSGQPVSNLASTPAAISVIENRGVGSLGNGGLTDLLKGQPGTWASGYAGNPFDAPIAVRGFSNGSVNRVSLVVDGVGLNLPRSEVNTNFVFPELIERVELTRGDATIPFGNKAIGGAVNVILKKPRQHPGLRFGAEGGSWHTDREWTSGNWVKDSLAVGIFMGRYSQEGWRTYYGPNDYEEPLRRPGPWALYNVHGSLNWKITPRLSLDVSHLISDQRVPNYHAINSAMWERRDTRSILFNTFGGSPFDDFPDERRDSLTIIKLLYEGGLIGDIHLTGTGRTYDRSIGYLFGNLGNSYQRWTDFSGSLKYFREDEFGPVKNELSGGAEASNGRFAREDKGINILLNWSGLDAGFNFTQVLAASGVGSASLPWPAVSPLPITFSLDASYSGLGHSSLTKADLERNSVFMTNKTTLWDRLVLGVGYRFENYDLKDIYSQFNFTPNIVRGRVTREKSASQYSLGFIYDKELGSNVYYRHSRTYRFPHFDDMVNLGFTPGFTHPDPIWLLEPEEGTLEEVAIRHWFTRNIYASATYYELDMDNEIYYGPDPSAPDGFGGFFSRNLNVPLVSHWGVELESLIRLTPRWTLKGNYTRQKTITRTNWFPDPANPDRTTEDKWLTLNPADMGNASLDYNNEEWGFSAAIAYHYIGSRYFLNDVQNEQLALEPAKWGDLAFSQKFFDGMTSLYFGIKNFTDRQYAIQGSYSTYPAPDLYYWPNAGRTYFMGMKSDLDFERMRMPTVEDLKRMNRRLYGALNSGRSMFNGMGSWMRNMVR